MGFSSTVLLGAIAGFTIILGLPIARIPNPSPRSRAFLNALATGVLVFLLWDVITAATQPIDATLATARDGHPAKFVTLLVLFTGGFVIGLMSLVYFEGRFLRRQTGRNSWARNGMGVTPVHSRESGRRKDPGLFGNETWARGLRGHR